MPVYACVTCTRHRVVAFLPLFCSLSAGHLVQVGIESSAFGSCMQHAPCDSDDAYTCLSSTLTGCAGSAEQLFFWVGDYPYSDGSFELYTDATMDLQVREDDLGSLALTSFSNGSFEDQGSGKFFVAKSATEREEEADTSSTAYTENAFEWHVQTVASSADLVLTCGSDEAMVGFWKNGVLAQFAFLGVFLICNAQKYIPCSTAGTAHPRKSLFVRF